MSIKFDVSQHRHISVLNGAKVMGNRPGAIPDTQKALVLKDREAIEIVQIPVVQPKFGEVLLKIGSVGVCGSDKHFYFQGRCGSEIVKEPMIMGHEFGGQIVSVGPGVNSARLGERVSVDPLVPCGHCKFCLEGNYNICPSQRFFGVPGTFGAMQQYLCVPSQNAHVISDAVSDQAAAMVETISVALSAVNRGKVRIGTRVLITGGGPVGLFAVQVAIAAGATEVVLVEPQPGRREIGERFGASACSDLASVSGKYDVTIECSGVDAVRHDACLKTLSGGTVVLVGVGSSAASIPMSAVIEREVSVLGVMRYKFAWPTVIAALETHKIDADVLVSRVLPLDRALEAWIKPMDNEIKTILDING